MTGTRGHDEMSPLPASRHQWVQMRPVVWLRPGEIRHGSAFPMRVVLAEFTRRCLTLPIGGDGTGDVLRCLTRVFVVNGSPEPSALTVDASSPPRRYTTGRTGWV